MKRKGKKEKSALFAGQECSNTRNDRYSRFIRGTASGSVGGAFGARGAESVKPGNFSRELFGVE